MADSPTKNQPSLDQAERQVALKRLRALVATAHASLPRDVDAEVLSREIDEAMDADRRDRA